MGLSNSLQGTVEAVDIGLVVVLVVYLHDLARNMRLEGTVVVYTRENIGQYNAAVQSRIARFRAVIRLHDRSGSVAFPRVNEVLAKAATAGLAEVARRAARADGAARKRVVAILISSQWNMIRVNGTL